MSSADITPHQFRQLSPESTLGAEQSNTAVAELVPSRKKLEPSHQKPENEPNSEEPNSEKEPERQRPKLGFGNLNLIVTGWLVLIHAGAIFAPFVFSWEAIVLVVGLHWITGGIGICLSYHRLFTHTSFRTYRPVKWALAFIGGLAGEGPVTDWVANHRKHHALSDQEGDPHSPLDGAWWSHVFWLAVKKTPEGHKEHVQRWAPDLAKDKVLTWIGYMFLPSHFITGLILLGAGYAYGGLYYGLSFLAWGLFARLVAVLHSTWFVNSASHIWGYTNYETTDESRNNWWVALITYGEGWHNNHHAYPRMANHGHRWWEIDVTFTTIRIMQKLGLAWDVVDYKKASDKTE